MKQSICMHKAQCRDQKLVHGKLKTFASRPYRSIIATDELSGHLRHRNFIGMVSTAAMAHVSRMSMTRQEQISCVVGVKPYAQKAILTV